ncbi:nitrogen fixation protein NifQ [Paraburkholderia sp.]|uniref:nitrogen fixation protein NifQ n=1 Tax=Paraburkholderia sp. TaxID=1926495 RepID=UPI002395C4F4|nr:nitrogen fixation protein NifQ [Paraburkholderia sp.]MDE1182310.1 nitrogen fixation protein NifQ [Paraburkholderia sp.]
MAASGASAHACSHAFDAWLFARLVAAREVFGELAWLGLSDQQTAALFARHFPAIRAPSLTVTGAFPLTVQHTAHATFISSMKRLLQTHTSAAVDPADADCLASIIAHACLRPDHLWRDLGLRGRDDVTQMLDRYVPSLVARNVDNLRWKKLLARELALSLGETPGPAPGCPGCEDFSFCFPKA